MRVISCIITAVLFFCAAGLSAEQSALKVGVTVPLSGTFAGMGKAFIDGVELYGQDNPSSPARIGFYFEDHRYDGKTAVSALHKLRTVNKVDFLIVWGNTPSGTCAPIAENLKFPMLAVTYNPDAKGRKYVISFGPKVKHGVERIAQQFRDWNLTNPAAVSVDVGNALLAVNMLKEKVDGDLLVRTVSTDEVDFKSILTGLRAKKVDGLLLFAAPNQAITFARQAVELNYRPKIIGGDVFADQSFQQNMVKHLGDLAYVYGAVQTEFLARLKKRSEDTSYFFDTATGYTLAALVDRLSQHRVKALSSNLINVMRGVSGEDVPVLGLNLDEDDEYGLHIDTAVKVYRVRG